MRCTRPIILIAAIASISATSAPAAAAPPGQGVDLDVEQILRELDADPSIDQVRAWAVAEARVSPQRIDRLLRDSRTRGALPLVRVRGRYKDGTNRKWDDLDLLDSRDRDLDYTLDLWVEWDLAELAASADTYRAAREARALTELRQGVLTQVNIAFFDRRRLIAEERLAAEGEPLDRTLVRRLRIQELDATLDALTGGRWGGALRASHHAGDAPRRLEEPLAPENSRPTPSGRTTRQE